MATAMKFVFACAVLANFSLLFVHSGQPCNVPTRFWCDNEELATRCGVLDQCKEFQWARDEGEKVEFAVYYESLCPDCQGFITKMLFPNYANLSSIMNLTLVPFGNAYEKKVGDKWVFDCQHGEQECIGNVIETCTIALVKNITKYFPFINCMEASELHPEAAAKKCAIAFPVPIGDILKCSKSDYGNQLEHEMAVKTGALKPSHRYVPWVTVNGVHTEAIEKEAEENLVKLICDTYKVEENMTYVLKPEHVSALVMTRGEKPSVCK